MSETRYDEENDSWEVVAKLKFAGEKTLNNLKDLHGVGVVNELVSAICEDALIQFARELAKTGVDKNLIAAEVIARGVDKKTVGIALGLDNPVTA